MSIVASAVARVVWLAWTVRWVGAYLQLRLERGHLGLREVLACHRNHVRCLREQRNPEQPRQRWAAHGWVRAAAVGWRRAGARRWEGWPAPSSRCPTASPCRRDCAHPTQVNERTQDNRKDETGCVPRGAAERRQRRSPEDGRDTQTTAAAGVVSSAYLALFDD